MGWDVTIPAPVVPPAVAYSEVAADSATMLTTAKGKIAAVFIKLSAAVPATKTLTVAVKVNGTTVSTFTLLPADSTNAKELVVNKPVAKADAVTLTLTGSDATVTGTASITVGLDA
jgi:hypothetical protein